MARPKIPLADRFWNKVNKNGPVVRPELGPCWIWIGKTNNYGYGVAKSNGVSLGTHRASWQFSRGVIPDGLKVLHRCDNPPCVNPDHLFLGTHADNMRDMTAKGRNYKGGNPKVTEDQVREIRIKRAQGVSRIVLAREYKVTVWAIKDIVTRRNWSHVD